MLMATTLIKNAIVISAGRNNGKCGIYITGDGRIADVVRMEDFDRSRYPEDANEIDASGCIACAGLIDTHIHGIGGFSTDDASSNSILGMSEWLSSFGVTSFVPTVYAGSPEKMETEIRAIVQAMGKERGARILGINLEGPFLSPQKCGAQDKDALSLPDVEIAKRLLEAGEGKVIAMTIAPELPNAEPVAQYAKQKGVVLLMGHTNATYEQALKAIDFGVCHVTHTFNAMSTFDHKAPGVMGAAMMDQGLCCEVIADGVHVHKDIVKHLIKTKDTDKVVLITDSLGPTSLGKGNFIANGEAVVLGDVGAFVDAEDPSKLCGSALTLNRAVANVTGWGIERPHAIRMATENPAKAYNLKELGSIAKGYLADIVIFDKSFQPRHVFIGGQHVFEGN